MADDAGVERTKDGRWIVVDGRRWPATDPAIPESLRKELVSELMSARRAVRVSDDDEATAAARRRVQDAKVALGERGPRWWEGWEASDREPRVEAAIRALLRKRDPQSTICPSDAARVAGGERWRELMEPAREIGARMAESDQLEIRQGGERVDPGRPPAGPIRLGRGPRFDSAGAG